MLNVTLSYWSTANVETTISGASLTGVKVTVIVPAALVNKPSEAVKVNESVVVSDPSWV